MKKALAIILCAVAVCFASCNKEPEEKPNQRFVGNYSGDVTANFNISALGQAVPMEPVEMPMTMSITAGSNDNEIVAICTIQEEARTLTGTVNGDAVDFSPLVINENIEGSQVNITIDLDGNKVSENTLNVAGNMSGEGTLLVEGYPIPVTMTGTASGVLNKLVAE